MLRYEAYQFAITHSWSLLIELVSPIFNPSLCHEAQITESGLNREL